MQNNIFLYFINLVIFIGIIYLRFENNTIYIFSKIWNFYNFHQNKRKKKLIILFVQ